MRRLPLVTLALLALVGLALHLSGRDDGDDDVGVDVTSPVATQVPTPAAEGDEVVTVRTVHDGDSFAVDDQVDVRMLGINAPEHDECLGRESRTALKGLIGDREVGLTRDVSDRDQYARLLRYVVVDGISANQQMVEQGLALTTSTEPDIAHRTELDAAQVRARAAGLGIWSPNACGPAASTAVRITEAEADPRGRDEQNLNGEYVVIVNDGSTPVDMTGWKLRDDSTRNRFWFPDGFVLQPGHQVTVHAGHGDNSADALYWKRRNPVWDNTRDMALLLDPNGNAVSVMDVRPR
ncbi:MAG TPA: lamin tail domain-containing protein [Acidimicrobiales bacterium]